LIYISHVLVVDEDFHSQVATERKEGLEGEGEGGNLKAFQFSFWKKKDEEVKEKKERKKKKIKETPIVLAESSFKNWENIQKPHRRGRDRSRSGMQHL